MAEHTTNHEITDANLLSHKISLSPSTLLATARLPKFAQSANGVDDGDDQPLAPDRREPALEGTTSSCIRRRSPWFVWKNEQRIDDDDERSRRGGGVPVIPVRNRERCVEWRLAICTLIGLGVVACSSFIGAVSMLRENSAWGLSHDRATSVYLVFNISAALHSLQRERGLSSVFLVTQSTDIAFDLAKIEAATDLALSTLETSLSDYLLSFPVKSYVSSSPPPPSSSLVKRRVDEEEKEEEGDDWGGEKGKRSRSMEYDNATDGRGEMDTSDGTQLADEVYRAVSSLTRVRGSVHSLTNRSDVSASLETEFKFLSSSQWYTDFIQLLLRLSSAVCTEMMLGMDTPKELASNVYAFLNFLELKEKYGMERMIRTSVVAHFEQVCSENMKEGTARKVEPSWCLSALLRLHETISQQEGFNKIFLSFASLHIKALADDHNSLACVVQAVQLRESLAQHLHTLSTSTAVVTAHDPPLLSHSSTRIVDPRRNLSSSGVSYPYAAASEESNNNPPVNPHSSCLSVTEHWEASVKQHWEASTCLIDGQHRIVVAMMRDIEVCMFASQLRGQQRAVRIIVPKLVASFVVLLILGYAVHTWVTKTTTTDARIGHLVKTQGLYKTLAQRWAPLSVAQHMKEEDDVAEDGDDDTLGCRR